MLSMRIVDTLVLLISATNAIRIALISQNDCAFLLAFPDTPFISLSSRRLVQPGCYRASILRCNVLPRAPVGMSH
ncbi:hypothetical protein CR51_19910 [Caballeronia megalochromosomata]|nr:hypothetical protein CR51_19910 [Caballeronia megalochromosomata]